MLIKYIELKFEMQSHFETKSTPGIDKLLILYQI